MHGDQALLHYKRGEAYRAIGSRKLAHQEFMLAVDRFPAGVWRDRAQFAAMRRRISAVILQTPQAMPACPATSPMPTPDDFTARGNRVLAALPREELERLQPHLEPFELRAGHVLAHAGDAISHVYFVETGLISMVASTSAGATVEVAFVGESLRIAPAEVCRKPTDARPGDQGPGTKDQGPRTRDQGPRTRDHVASTAAVSGGRLRPCPHLSP